MIKKNLGGYGRDLDTINFTQLAHRLREQRAISRDFEANKRIIEAAVRPSPPEDTMSVADRVIRAGARRRGEVPCEGQLTDLSPNAADSPAVATAKLVILAGKRRRGEIE
jgi:hypothetical protein